MMIAAMQKERMEMIAAMQEAADKIARTASIEALREEFKRDDADASGVKEEDEEIE